MCNKILTSIFICSAFQKTTKKIGHKICLNTTIKSIHWNVKLIDKNYEKVLFLLYLTYLCVTHFMLFAVAKFTCSWEKRDVTRLSLFFSTEVK